MFTGIIQATGLVHALRRAAAGARLSLEAPDLPRPITEGASIAVNGACLTVTRSDDTFIEFDVVPETLERTTLGALTAGQRVNLEPSLRLGDPLDGHWVQGHVDGTARVADIRRGPEGQAWRFEPEQELLLCIIPKGSIAVDGVSLTIAAVDQTAFSVALIPTTLERTNLGALQIGNRVNIETDIIARTIVATLERTQSQPHPRLVSVNALRENGW